MMLNNSQASRSMTPHSINVRCSAANIFNLYSSPVPRVPKMEASESEKEFATRITTNRKDYPSDDGMRPNKNYTQSDYVNKIKSISHSKYNFKHSIDVTTDLDSFRLPNKGEANEYQGINKLCKKQYCCFTNSDKGTSRELHKRHDKYVQESISIKRRVARIIYGLPRSAADSKYIEVDWTEASGRTIGLRVRWLAVLGLFLTMLATCAAAPSPATFSRIGPVNDKTVRHYLETFGYLKKGQPEVGNLLSGDAEQAYEDDFRIAIKTLQEFGGLPVTGEMDDATKELLAKRRCGRPDIETNDESHRRWKRFAVQGEKWKHTNLTWSLSSVRRPSQLDVYGTRRVLARALDVWEQASRLTFTEINSDEADIVVSFAKRYHDDAYPFDGRGSILAHAFFPGSGRGGDAHFDDDELWLLQPKNDDEEGTSLFAVAAHEFGHSLGLSHSSVKGALMFPWYQGIQPNFVLPEDDRNGIQQMYGPKERRTWAKIPFYRPVEPPTTPATTTVITTTRRPYIHTHHHGRHPDRHPNHRNTYTPYPRPPFKYPAYYPERPSYPDKPIYPNYPGRKNYTVVDDNPRRTHNNYPRPSPETTTQSPTTRSRYPNIRPEYPSHPRPNYPSDFPSDPRQDYPKREYPKTKPYYPEKTTIKPTLPSDKPDTCDTNYDAITLIRGELFIFKNRYHWRIGAQGHYDGYPIEISRMWSALPKNLSHIDAVYERPDRKIAFFIGTELYLFDSQHLVRGYPRKLTDLGLPENLYKIDAAMIWGHNGKTYFYSGSMYWKFDEEEGRVELDYPRDMAMWKGVGYNIDSVFQWKDGKTYFFKGKGYWKFNDLQMRVEHERQLPSAPFWMGCSTERGGRRAPYRALPAPGSTLRSPSSAKALQSFSFTILILPFIFLKYCSII